MEAIGDLIGALIGALTEAFIAILNLLASLIAIAIEFLFIAITQGLDAARKRKDERLKSKQESQPDDANDVAAKAEVNKLIVIIMGMILVAVPVTWLAISRTRARHEREDAEVEQQIETLADKFQENCRVKRLPDGYRELDIRDRWDRRLELFVDHFTLSTLVVVRSAGRDRKRKTVDDRLAIRSVPREMKDVAKDAAKKQMGNLKDRAKKLLDRFRRNDEGDENEANQPGDE